MFIIGDEEQHRVVPTDEFIYHNALWGHKALERPIWGKGYQTFMVPKPEGPILTGPVLVQGNNDILSRRLGQTILHCRPLENPIVACKKIGLRKRFWLFKK